MTHSTATTGNNTVAYLKLPKRADLKSSHHEEKHSVTMYIQTESLCHPPELI